MSDIACEVCKKNLPEKTGRIFFYDKYFCGSFSDECRQLWVTLPTSACTTSRMFQEWRQERNPGKEIPLVSIRIAKKLRKLIPEYNLFAEYMNNMPYRVEDNVPAMEIVTEMPEYPDMRVSPNISKTS